MRNRTGTIARTSRETSRKGTKQNWFRTEASSDAAERSSGRGGLRDVEDAVTENGVFLSYLSVRVSEHWAFGLWYTGFKLAEARGKKKIINKPLN